MAGINLHIKSRSLLHYGITWKILWSEVQRNFFFWNISFWSNWKIADKYCLSKMSGLDVGNLAGAVLPICSYCLLTLPLPSRWTGGVTAPKHDISQINTSRRQLLRQHSRDRGHIQEKKCKSKYPSFSMQYKSSAYIAYSIFLSLSGGFWHRSAILLLPI